MHVDNSCAKVRYVIGIYAIAFMEEVFIMPDPNTAQWKEIER